MSDFNVLGYFGVSSSQISGKGPNSASTSCNVAILAPRQKIHEALLPRATTPGPQLYNKVSQPTTDRNPPATSVPISTSQKLTAETSRTPQRGIEVYEGTIPSNIAINKLMCEQRQSQRAAERERDRATAAEQREMDKKAIHHEVEGKMIKRDTANREWGEYMAMVQANREAARRRIETQREEEGRQNAEAKQALAREAQFTKDGKTILSRQLRQQLQDEIERKTQLKANFAEEERQRLYNATLVAAQGVQKDRQAEMVQQTILRQAWESQQRIREERLKAKVINDKALIAVTQQMAAEKAEMDKEERQRQRNAKVALRSELAQAMQQKAMSKSNQRAHMRETERRDMEACRIEAQKITAQEKQRQTLLKDELMTGIAKQVEEKYSASRSRAAADKGPTVEPESKVFVRCPSTGRLLPPEFFNLTAATVRSTLKRVS